jgi:ABC-2 type transport system permease protein
MIWYFAAAMFVSKVSFNYADTNISEKIISGNLLYDLTRPVSIAAIEVAHVFAHRIVSLVTEILPLFLLYAVWIFPVFLDMWAIMKFICLALGCAVMYFYLRFIIGLLAFYLKENKGLIVVSNIMITFFGGGFFPLEFLPAQFNDVLDYLPFKYLFYWPVQFFLNRPQTDDIWFFLRILGIQCIWIVIFYVIFKILMKSSLKSYCGAGG